MCVYLNVTISEYTETPCLADHFTGTYVIYVFRTHIKNNRVWYCRPVSLMPKFFHRRFSFNITYLLAFKSFSKWTIKAIVPIFLRKTKGCLNLSFEIIFKLMTIRKITKCCLLLSKATLSKHFQQSFLLVFKYFMSLEYIEAFPFKNRQSKMKFN